MMKKIVNILFLMLTTLFVAHAVMPHHHHNSMICIERSHCADDKKAHEHSEETNQHQHDGNKDTQTCILKQIIITNLNNQTQKVCKCVNCNNNFPIILIAILFSDFDYYSVKITDFSYFHIIQSDYSVFVPKCFGLRAPPIV